MPVKEYDCLLAGQNRVNWVEFSLHSICRFLPFSNHHFVVFVILFISVPETFFIICISVSLDKSLNKVEAKLGPESKPAYDKLEQDVDAVYKAAKAHDVEGTAKALERASGHLKDSLKFSKKYPILHELSVTLVSIFDTLAKNIRKDKNTNVILENMRLLAWVLNFVLKLNEKWTKSMVGACFWYNSLSQLFRKSSIDYCNSKYWMHFNSFACYHVDFFLKLSMQLEFK